MLVIYTVHNVRGYLYMFQQLLSVQQVGSTQHEIWISLRSVVLFETVFYVMNI